MRHDSGCDLANQLGGASLYERHIEFDDVRLHEGQERRRRGISAEVVECNSGPHGSHMCEAAQHARRVAGEMTFGDFDHELVAEPPSNRAVDGWASVCGSALMNTATFRLTDRAARIARLMQSWSS
jgi:hypothetical protein